MPGLEFRARGGGRDGFVEDHFTLAIEYAAGVEFGDARDVGAGGGLCGVEVDDFLGVVFEGEDDGVGREGGEVGVEFLALLLDEVVEVDDGKQSHVEVV